MRGVVLSRSHLSSTLLVSLLMLSTHVMWAQRTPTLRRALSGFLMHHHGLQQCRKRKHIFISLTKDYCRASRKIRTGPSRG